ncbi:MAG TPA: amidohydrolase family protein [Alphaproteobacteria bacterium]|nr:amidohydrolase family protein [Alphaproteobacteria bacterium]
MVDPAAEAIAWDVHAHLVPFMPERLGSIDEVSAVEGRLKIDGHLLGIGDLFEPSRLVDWMGENQIARALVSAPPPTYRPHLDAGAARQWSGYLNDGLIDICAAFKRTLQPMLHLPIRHPDLAAEIVGAGSDASVNRFSLPAGASGDRVLSDPEFEPLWSALAACNAFVFIHPATCCDGRLGTFYLENLVGNPYETTVAAAHLLFGGVLERFPAINFCLAHGGGALAMLAGRWQRGFDTARPGIDTTRAPPADLVRRFSVDCILHDAGAIAVAAQTVGESNVLFGSDWPFPMGLPEPHRQLASLAPKLRRGILSENASAIVG